MEGQQLEMFGTQQEQQKLVTVWHGTTSRAAKQIKKEGLRWDRGNRFHTQWLDFAGRAWDQPDADDPAVRVTSNKDLAGWYARFRYEYSKLEPGKHLGFHVTYGDVDREFDLIKRPTEPTLHKGEMPALVKFEVPEEFMQKHATADPNDRAAGGVMLDTPIPPEYVVSVQRVTIQ